MLFCLKITDFIAFFLRKVHFVHIPYSCGIIISLCHSIVIIPSYHSNDIVISGISRRHNYAMMLYLMPEYTPFDA